MKHKANACTRVYCAQQQAGVCESAATHKSADTVLAGIRVYPHTRLLPPAQNSADTDALLASFEAITCCTAVRARRTQRGYVVANHERTRRNTRGLHQGTGRIGLKQRIRQTIWRVKSVSRVKHVSSADDRAAHTDTTGNIQHYKKAAEHNK